MSTDPLPRLRALCLGMPDTYETVSHGAPTFWAGKRVFATFAAPDNHHGRGRPAVWLKAGPGNQEIMVAAAPERFFVPPYVGPSGWVGIWLDRRVPWKEVARLLDDARVIAARPRPRTRR